MKLSDGWGGERAWRGEAEGGKERPRWAPRQVLEAGGGRVIIRNPGPEGVWGGLGCISPPPRKGLGIRLMSHYPGQHVCGGFVFRAREITTPATRPRSDVHSRTLPSQTHLAAGSGGPVVVAVVVAVLFA
ncbi:hypothetical protein E2C01_017062 [Portunus trituberculatus]|uniref:Uncharacterized protein n=1 Tax=Portunus trituberculatus TaxID=210409 RepID=A0A5B7DQW3_PORTR|nr:hypothetical protein [Portunus trituberculatus]